MTIAQACTIAGSDSGGGAGIQADLKTFQERRVFGTSVIVAITAQNTKGVHRIDKLPHESVRAQLEAVFDDFNLGAIKTGMLADETYIREIAHFLRQYPNVPLVVDPVMIAKGGAALMENASLSAMIEEMVPLATLITPNIPEAETITGMTIKTEQDMLNTAKKIQALGSKNVLVKGGHALNDDEARDCLVTSEGEVRWFGGPRYDTKDTHGTGCTYSACITAELAKGHTMIEAVEVGKRYIDAAIRDGLGIGHGHGPTNHWAYRKVERSHDD